jgi:hypothetical protein
MMHETRAPKVAMCADLRGLQVLPETIHAPIATGMRRLNPHLLRSAVLLSDVSLMQQVDRIIAQAPHPDLTTCHDAASALAWLVGCLDSAERRTLSLFLRGGF